MGESISQNFECFLSLRFEYSIRAIHGYSVIFVSSPPMIRSSNELPQVPSGGKSLTVKDGPLGTGRGVLTTGGWVGFGCGVSGGQHTYEWNEKNVIRKIQSIFYLILNEKFGKQNEIIVTQGYPL